jgi:hypothetical protein
MDIGLKISIFIKEMYLSIFSFLMLNNIPFTSLKSIFSVSNWPSSASSEPRRSIVVIFTVPTLSDSHLMRYTNLPGNLTSTDGGVSSLTYKSKPSPSGRKSSLLYSSTSNSSATASWTVILLSGSLFIISTIASLLGQV